MKPLVLLGAGCRGIDELRDSLDDGDTAVRWAFMQFELGSGTLCRKKCIFLHINGANCPAVARGRANEYTAAAQDILRCGGHSFFHACLEVERKADVTAENVFGRARRVFVADDAGEYAVKWRALHHEVHVPGRPGQTAQAGDGELGGATCRAVPGHLSAARLIAGRDALRAVARAHGAWSWVLFEADPQSLPVVGAGSGSVEEMRECAASRQSDVLYGVLRMEFGVGQLHCTKHVFVHVIGAKAGIVARGRAIAMRRRMLDVVAEFACISLTFEAASLEDLTSGAVMERARQVVGLSDDEVGVDVPPTAMVSAIEFSRAAVRGSRCRALPAGPAKPQQHSVQYVDEMIEEVVALVHAPDAPLNWALFGPNEQLLRERRRSSTAPAAASSPVAGSPAAEAPMSPGGACARAAMAGMEGVDTAWSRSTSAGSSPSSTGSSSAAASPHAELLRGCQQEGPAVVVRADPRPHPRDVAPLRRAAQGTPEEEPQREAPPDWRFGFPATFEVGGNRAFSDAEIWQPFSSDDLPAKGTPAVEPAEGPTKDSRASPGAGGATSIASLVGLWLRGLRGGGPTPGAGGACSQR